MTPLKRLGNSYVHIKTGLLRNINLLFALLEDIKQASLAFMKAHLEASSFVLTLAFIFFNVPSNSQTPLPEICMH